MATRMIVTSQPDVACDVCGRRLLRGEQPDVFLASGRRRTVCELCAPRASHEGWLRETDQHSLNLPPARPRRGRNLFGRLRQQREPIADPSVAPANETEFTAPLPADPGNGVASYDFFDGGPEAADRSEIGQPEPGIGETVQPVPAVPFSDATPAPTPAGGFVNGALTSGEVKMQRALDVFNAGEHPRRVAGVARSLGAPTVTVRPLAESGSAVVAIVIAWELSWYRYEVDLGDEAAGASVAAQGTELSELAGEDQLANGEAAADGALSLVGSVAR
jgi:hypothetical protein